MYDIDITSLLKPIRNDQPCGIDRLSDSKVDAEHTIIKDARRSDDQSLPLGPYQKAFKTADWHKVKKLSIDFLANSSKEIEVVGWLLEALIYLYHLEGLHQGLRLLDSMLNLFWSDIYPLDEEIRATQLRLIQKSLSNAVRKLPLTSTVTGSLNWHDWSEYNNLSKSNYQKLDMDQHAKIASFIDNIHNTPFDFYTKFSSNLEEVSQAIATLQATLISRFKNEAPPTITDFHMAIADIGNGIDDVLKQQKNRVQAYGSQDAMAEELQQIKVLESVSDETQNFVTISNESPVLNQNQIPVLKAVDHESDVSTNQFGPQSSSESFDSDGDETSNPTSGSVFQRSDYKGHTSHKPSSDQEENKMLDEAFTHDQALRQLLLIADFFQTTEPYNPISYLLRRAISWGNMTLEDWLGEVVQDEIALKSIQKTLGINQNGLDK